MPSRSNLFSGLLSALGLVLALAAPACADETLKLIPEQFTLSGTAASQALVLEMVAGTNATGQIVEGVAYASSDPAIVKIDEGRAVPLANGKATITATVTTTAGDRKATAEVTVVEMDKPFQWSFRNHVESVISKSGCNSVRVTARWPAKRASSFRWARSIRWLITSPLRDKPGHGAWC